MVRTCFKEKSDRRGEISIGNVCRRKERKKGKTEKVVVGCEIKRAGVSVEDAVDRAKRKLRTMVADSKWLREIDEGNEKED